MPRSTTPSTSPALVSKWLEVGPELQGLLEEAEVRSQIYTSATLRTSGTFDWVRRDLALELPIGHVAPSPFSDEQADRLGRAGRAEADFDLGFGEAVLCEIGGVLVKTDHQLGRVPHRQDDLRKQDPRGCVVVPQSRHQID